MKIEEISFEIEDKDRPIVLVDSGEGGLNVLDKLSQKFPIENFVYFCDNDFLPYGTKDPRLLKRRVSKIIKKLKILKPKALVVACNTLDAVAGEQFQASFPGIPVYRVIDITAKKALDVSKKKNIAVLATKNTVESQKYALSMLTKNLNLYAVECLNLATAIENNEDVEEVLDREIQPLEGVEFDTLILGCTHYYVVKPMIEKKWKTIEVVDSSEILIQSVVNDFPEILRNRASKQKLYTILTKDDEKTEDKVKSRLENNVIIIKEEI